MPAEVTTAHDLLYVTDSPITAKSLAESLMGLEGVVGKSALVLRKLMPDLALVETQVLISRIEHGSYKESFLVRLILGCGEELEKRIEALRVRLSLKKMDAKTIIGISILGAILYAAWEFRQSKADANVASDLATVHIENSFNSIGAELNLTAADVKAILDAALQKDKEALKKQVVKLAHPGGDARGEKLVLDGNDARSISEEVIQAIPADYKAEEAEEPFRDFQKVQMIVRAADLDRPLTGWAGIVPEVADKRLVLSLAPEIDPAKVPIGKYFNADITLLYRLDKQGKNTPKRLLLRRVLDRTHRSQIAHSETGRLRA